MKYKMFVLGQNFTVVTDHRPLVSLFNSPSKPGPFRVERLRLKLHGFTFEVIHKSEKWNASDYLSRHPSPIRDLTAKELEGTIELECHVINIVKLNIPTALTIMDIQEGTASDPILRKIISGLKSATLDGNDSDMKEYRRFIDEFSVARDVVMRGDRIVILPSLRKKVICVGHEGHQGVVKTKQLLRSKM